jgi:uncharacterized membrane protein required for colicin V production
MDTLDLVILGVAVMAAVGGYRLGFLARVISWLGMALGVYLAVKLLPTVVSHLSNSSPTTVLVVAVVILVGGAMVGQAVGLLAGGQLHRILPLGPVRLVDRAVGAVVGAAGVFAILWLLIPSLAQVSGWPSRAVIGSSISRLVSRDLPPPPSALQLLRRVIGNGSPEVFAVLQPNRASGPPPANIPLSQAVAADVQSSTVKVQGQACGQIIEQRLHCTHRSGSQIGTSRAMRRFSYRLVPVGQVPSGGKALTGSRSPRPSRSSRVTRWTNSGASAGTVGRRTGVASAVTGTAISWSTAMVPSIAAVLRRTTSGPRRPHVVTTESFIRSIASSKGSTALRAKKQACMIVLIRRPSPCSSASR